MAYLRLTHRNDSRDGPEPIFGLPREDATASIELNICHRSFRVKSFAPKAAFGIEKNHPKLPTARYVSIGLTHDFGGNAWNAPTGVVHLSGWNCPVFGLTTR